MSSSHLCPCPACNRHVMTDAGVCPFCQAALPASFCATSQSPAARARMSRAARLLAGATLVGASACSGSPVVAPPYGRPPPYDAARPDRDVDSGAGGTAGSDAATGTGGAPATDAADDGSVDGGPPPTDGSSSG